MNHATKMYFINQNVVKLRALQQLCACCSTRANSSLPSTKPASSPAAKPRNPGNGLTKLEQDGVEIKVVPSARNEVVEAVTYGRLPGTFRKTEILRMDPEEYANHTVGTKKESLLHRRGEYTTYWAHLVPEREFNRVDRMAFIQQEIDLRPVALKRIWRNIEAEHEIKSQEYIPERNKILGNELAAAHFVVFRKGKVKFLHHSEWVTQYRVDQDTEEDPRDLVPLEQNLDLMTLPRFYDPLYRLEAIDASGVPLLYNGLANFEGLDNVTWLSFRGADKRFDDWCLDRLYNIFKQSLEYLDLSECKGISERGLAAAWRLKHLKTLVVENMPHVKNLEMVCSLLEEQIPGLTCVGVDYERKALELKKEAEEAERLEQERLAELEAGTINVTPRLNSDDHEHDHVRRETPQLQAGRQRQDELEKENFGSNR